MAVYRLADPRALLTAALLLAVLVGASREADAQRVGVRVAQAPYFVGVPVQIEVHSDGLERKPEPSCSAVQPSGGELTLRGISPNIESSISIINGKMTRSERVRFTCHYQFVSSQEGRASVGPFTVSQNATVLTADAVQLDVTAVPLDPRLKLRVRAPDHPVYLGQHVPVEIEWWLEADLVERIHGFRIRSPLFTREEDFRFIDDELAARGDQALRIETAQGQLNLKASVDRRIEKGTEYVVLSATRTLVPLRTGRFELTPAQVSVEEVLRWRRDFFGGRTASQTRRLLSRDVRRTLEVREPPGQGQPPSFAGAVGRGFQLDVAADRSVVQRGDPIALTFTIRGDGNLRAVGPPVLTGPGGLSPEQFSLPDGAITGRMQEDTKIFEVTLRVLDESVREIPAIEYAWFDPNEGIYQTTRSRPIALSVNPAQMVSAEDVVVSPALSKQTTKREAEAASGAAPRDADSPRFDFADADLSIERDLETLMGRGPAGPGLAVAAHLLALALVAGAFVWRRRREADPEGARLREQLRRQRELIAGLSQSPSSDEVRALSAALRAVAAATGGGGPELGALLQECDDLVYAPPGASASSPGAALRERALALIDAALKEVKS